MNTQFFESYSGSITPHAPREHDNEERARAYAKELSGRRDGQVAVMREDGTPVDTYVDGVSCWETEQLAEPLVDSAPKPRAKRQRKQVVN